MKMIFKIARMELQKMFYSPIAWLILVVFSIQAGIVLMRLSNMTVVNAGLGYATSNLTTILFTGMSGVLNRMQNSLYLYIPLLTMGLLSHEFSSGSIKLLYSAPISNKQIVLGKFVSMMMFGLVLMFILFLVAIFGVIVIKDFDFPLVLTAMLGLYLMICAYAAVGLFVSSLTSYQIVAAIGTFALLFVLSFIGTTWQDIEFVRDITYWLSINGRSDTLIRGLISSEDILYFVLVSGLFITFTILRLKSLREKSPKYISVLRYVSVFILVSAIGFISTLPSLSVYYDATTTKINTLTPNSQEVISKLKGKVKITTYVNIFDSNFWYGAPANQKFDMSRYEQYMRFYPNMDLEYKYYYALPVEEQALKSYNKRFKGLTIQQALEKASNLSEVDSKLFKPADAYLSEIDLNAELNRCVSKVTDEEGNTTYLRFYNDMTRVPKESQITAAFKKLTEKLPLVGFIKGHEERDINTNDSRGYSLLAKEKNFRYALINNGFDFTELELSKPVDRNISILIIADAKTAFSEVELKNLNDYIDRGGNLVIACDLKRQDIMNPLVERFGVTFLPGQIVEHNKGYSMDLVTSTVTEEGQKIAYQFESIGDKTPVMMPGAVSINYDENGLFAYTPVLVSDTVHNIASIDSVGSWNELLTTDFIDDIAKYDANAGDMAGPQVTALALHRKTNGKEQRIMLLGDADCFCNGELSTNRKGYRAQNFKMGTGMFYWLSNDEVPIDVRRPQLTDNKMFLEKSNMTFLNILYKVIIPALFALTFLIIRLRRNSR